MGRGVSALPDRLDVVIPQDYTVRRQTVQMWCDQAACAVHEAHFIVAEICQITAGSGETRSGNAPLAQGNLHLLLLQLLQHSPSASKNITEGFEAPTAMEPQTSNASSRRLLAAPRVEQAAAALMLPMPTARGASSPQKRSFSAGQPGCWLLHMRPLLTP